VVDVVVAGDAGVRGGEAVVVVGAGGSRRARLQGFGFEFGFSDAEFDFSSSFVFYVCHFFSVLCRVDAPVCGSVRGIEIDSLPRS
jgi:hypothetical protein